MKKYSAQEKKLCIDFVVQFKIKLHFFHTFIYLRINMLNITHNCERQEKGKYTLNALELLP